MRQDSWTLVYCSASLKNKPGWEPHRMSGSSEEHDMKPGIGPVISSGDVLTWEESQAMIPLVSSIVRDLMGLANDLDQCEEELTSLPRMGEMDWRGRSKAYQLQEQVATISQDLRNAYLELEVLHLTLLNAETGMVGFPTMVNNRRAFFTFTVGDKSIDNWCYSSDSTLRPVPKSWIRTVAMREVA